MNITPNKSVVAKSYMFAITLSEPIREKNTHDQLYEALLATPGNWYQAQPNEPRCIQFIRKGNFLICRSTRKPPSDIALEETLEVSGSDYMQIDVRLPKSRRTDRDHPRGKGKSIPLHDHELADYFKALLSRHGMGVLSLDIKPAHDHNIFFTVNKAVVDIQTCDVRATVKITNAADFESAYLYGIGRYKTYGCGMIQANKIEG